MSKTLLLSTNVDQKLLETEFLIAICRQIGDKWQSKALFPAIFYWCSSIVKNVFHCRLPGVLLAEESIMVNENESTIKEHQFQRSDTSRHRQTDIKTPIKQKIR